MSHSFLFTQLLTYLGFFKPSFDTFDCIFVQGVKLKPMDLSRAAKLLTDPHSNRLFERHVQALKRVAARYVSLRKKPN